MKKPRRYGEHHQLPGEQLYTQIEHKAPEGNSRNQVQLLLIPDHEIMQKNSKERHKHAHTTSTARAYPYNSIEMLQAPRGYDQHQLQGEQSYIQIEQTVPEEIIINRVQQFVNPDHALSPLYIAETMQENAMEIHEQPQTTSASTFYPHYTIEMLQVNVREEHNYSMAPSAPKVQFPPLASPKGTCRMRPNSHLKPFLFRKLEKLDYFNEVSAENIANYQLQCTSIGQPYLQANIRTLHLRTIVSGDILAALFPRIQPTLVKDLELVLQCLSEFHYNAWEQREQRKVISKSTHRTIHILSAQALLLFFAYSTPFQSKSLNFDSNTRHFEMCNYLSNTAVVIRREPAVRPADTLDDLSLAIDPGILAQMAELKQNL